MELYHGSSNVIEKITASGRYGEFLFFATYGSAKSHGKYLYSINVQENEVIDASSLWYRHNPSEVSDLISLVSALFEVDQDTAANLIDGSENIKEYIEDPEEAAEADWDLQMYTAKVAKALGYRGVAVEDEHGTSYMIDMLGFENELSFE